MQSFSLYEISLFVCAGFAFCLSLLALSVGILAEDAKKWGLLALTGFAEAIYCVCLYYYLAAEDYGRSFFWIAIICIIMPHMTYFFAALTNHLVKPEKKWVESLPKFTAGFATVFSLLMASDLIWGTQLVFSSLDIEPHTLHGKLIKFNLFGNIWLSFVNIVFYICGFILVKAYWQNRKEMWPIVFGTCAYFLAIASDWNILFGIWDFYFIQHFGYLIMVSAVTYVFASDYIRSVHELQAAHEVIKQHREQMIHDEKLKLMGTMTSYIAHEIRNPLTVIYGAVQLVNAKLSHEPVVRKLAEKVDKSMKRCGDIIDVFSAFARKDSNEKVVRKMLRPLISDAIEIYHFRYQAEALTDIRIAVADDFEVACAETQMIQCLVNLLNNGHDAVKGQPQSWIKIGARYTDGFALIEVADSGKIPPDLAEEILQPFRTTKVRGAGTGLGLSITRYLVEKHHGRFGIDTSAPNTVFQIWLPVG